MKHRMFALMLAVMMLLCALPVSAEETTPPTDSTASTAPERAPGYCGDAIMWHYENSVLTLTGTGPMDDFPDGAPWKEHKDEIKTVIISGGITYIGAYSFNDYDKLTHVEFGKDVYEIGERAFFSCDGLTAIYLPESFKVFGPSSFMGCTKLKEIHCQGRFPSFRLNCMWDTYATIFFPAERPWGVEYIAQLEEAFHGRIEFLASDGSDPYEPTEAPAETEKPTEPPTEETTEPTEEPTTVPPTTEAPTETVTEPASTEADPVPEVTEAPSQAPEVPEKTEKSGGNGFVYILIGVVLGGAFLGKLILGGSRKKGRYSR